MFFLNVPRAAIVLALSPRFIPETRDRSRSSRVDYPGTALAVLDAGRSQVFAGEYRIENGPMLISEQLLSDEEFVLRAQVIPVITSDSRVAELARTVQSRVVVADRPRADTIVRQAWIKIAAGETVPPEVLDANYLRRSDAEIFSKAQPL